MVGVPHSVIDHASKMKDARERRLNELTGAWIRHCGIEHLKEYDLTLSKQVIQFIVEYENPPSRFEI